MADTNKQVTVMFESQVNNPQTDDPILLSGPIEVLGTTEKFSDLGTLETRDTIVEAYGLSEDIEYVPSITIFVDDVSALGINNPNHRGAYFRYAGTIEELFDDSRWSSNDSEGSAINLWKEILLGTHSHTNPEVLEKLSELFSVDSDGNIGLVDSENNPLKQKCDRCVPELPKALRDKLEEAKKYDDLNEPTDSEYNHLDAPLEELYDTYDWMRQDEDGNYKNLAVGNCREIYRALIKADSKLYFSLLDYSLGTTKKDEKSVWLQLEANKVNYNPGATVDSTTIVATQHPTNPNKIVFTINLPFNITSNDKIYLFDGNMIINNQLGPYGDMEDITLKDTHGYSAYTSQPNVLIVEFYKQDFQYKDDQTLTVMLACDASEIENIDFLFRKAFALEKVKLQDINAEIVKLYVAGELDRRPYIPQMYLTTDQYGTIYWDNKLLPSQTFAHKQLTITDVFLAEHVKDGKLTIDFGIPYSIADDFPLLLVNGFFEFDATPYADEDTGYLSFDFTADKLEVGDVLNLILIKKSSAGSIADELADKYISKKDAVSILSHGKIELSDYATLNKLAEYAPIGHTHSQYALKEHNHDYRYANYRHTHPELCALLLELSKNESVSEEDIQKWLDKIAESNVAQFKALVDALGFTETESGTYKFYSDKVSLSDEEVETINKALEGISSDVQLNSGDSVKDALLVLAKLFESSTVYDTDVLLKNDLVVTNKIGNTKATYAAGTTLETILSDMLHPSLSLSEIEQILTPDVKNIKLLFYQTNNEDIEVDINRVKNLNSLYFKVKLYNSNDELASNTIILDGHEFTQKAEAISVNGESPDENGFFHILDISANTDNDGVINIPLEIEYTITNNITKPSYKTSNIIYDTFCLSSSEFTPAKINYTVEGGFDYPDYYYCYVSPPEDEYSVSSLNIDDFTSGYGTDTAHLSIDVSTGGTLYYLLEDNYAKQPNILDRDNAINIFKFMDRTSAILKDGYTTYTYEFLNDASLNLAISTS